MCEKQEELIKQADVINQVLKEYFKGYNDSEKNDNREMLSIIHKPCEIKIKEQGEMKYKGITIHKNKNCNTWYTRYRENGKQYYISGRTQKEVLSILKNKLNYIKKEKTKTITLFDWYNQWLKLFKIGKVKESTIVDYEKSLKHIPTDILNNDITKITSLQINNLINGINKERTSQKVYELLNALFSKAKDYELIQKNVLDIIDKPKHTRERGIALTKEEQERFIKECNNQTHGDLLLVVMYQGLRIGECLGLTGTDIDLKNNTLTINKAIDEQGKKNTTKNEQSNRIIPLFNNTKKILEKFEHFGDKRIFNFSYHIPQKKLKEIVKKTGIRNISLHDLRHTFITNCKNKNIPEHIIQNWVGHIIGSSVTSKIYTHINKEDTQQYIDKFNN